MKVKFVDEMLLSVEDLVCFGCQKCFVLFLFLLCFYILCKKCIDVERILQKNGKFLCCLLCLRVLDLCCEFFLNFVVNNMVNKVVVQDNMFVDFVCDICEVMEEKVMMWCSNCYLFLCEFCFMVYCRMSVIKIYILQMVDQFRGQIFKGNNY